MQIAKNISKFGLLLNNDMQTSPHPPILKKSRFDFLVQIVEKHSETNKKRKKSAIYFFELW